MAGVMDALRGGLEIARNIRDLPANARSWSVLKAAMTDAHSGGEPDFFDLQTGVSFSTAVDVNGLTDSSISPIDLYDMVHKDTYFSGLFDQLVEAIFVNNFYIDVAKGEDGALLGNKKKAMYYEDLLRKANYRKIIEKLIFGKRADGGGNVLLFTTRGENGIEIQAEPFLEDGVERVKVYGDNKKKKVVRYEVIDNNQFVVYTLDPKKNYVLHSRYREAGNYMFSSNPAKKAVYWYVLKKYIAGSNLATYKNGLQEPVIGSPDYSALTALVNAMAGDGKVGRETKESYLRDPIAFLAKQSQLDDEILRTITGSAKRNNTFLKLKMPYIFQKIGRDNKGMDTIALLNHCDQQIGYALRTSKGVINTMDSKFANAEVETDNWGDLVVNPLKTEIENTTEEFILPALDPQYDRFVYPVKLGRDPNAEQIEIYNAKTARNTSNAGVIATLNNTGYELDLETEEIQRIGSKVTSTSSSDIVEQAEDEMQNEIESLERHYLYVYEDNIRESSQERLDRVYEKYHASVNMSRGELEKWSETECSKKAGVDRSPVRRNLELLDTLKKDWTNKHVTWANKTIGFIARMKKNLGGENVVTDADGNICGTKAHIALKNWAYDSEKERDATEYKTKMLRAKLNTVEQALETPDALKFEALIEKTVNNQIDSYVDKLGSYDNLQLAIGNLAKDIKPATQAGLPVNTFKQQLLKFARMGIEEFEQVSGIEVMTKRADWVYPESVTEIMDAKAQLMLKGYASLSESQKLIIDKYFSSEFTTYSGMDTELTSRINNILDNTYKSGQGVAEAISEILFQRDNISAWQAKRIAQTEISQAVESSKFELYSSNGWNEKKWLTVLDNDVRDKHREYAREGWVAIDYVYSGGTRTPTDEINCRCTLVYRKVEV